MGEILIITHPILQQLYLIRSKMLLIVRCIPISVTLKYSQDFPGGAVVENLPANAGDTGSSPGPGRSHMPRSN